MIFVVSGFEKIISPYQNFQYVIQGYEVVPESLEVLLAKSFPWFELISGIFLTLGLWIRISLGCCLLMVLTFLTIVSQALLRKLPITECGCFGDLVSFPLYVVLIIDITIFTCIMIVCKNLAKASNISLDSYFNE